MYALIIFVLIWLFIGLCAALIIAHLINRAGNKLRVGDFVMLGCITILGPLNLFLLVYM